MQYLDIDSWARKEQFYFFKKYQNPFFNICSYLDIAHLHKYTSQKKLPISYAYLYLSLKVSNEQEEFRYRIHHDKVVIYDKIRAGWITLKKNESFYFCYFDYMDSFGDFWEQVQEILGKIEESNPLQAEEHRDDLIYHSVLPWIHFSSISHAHQMPRTDSVPRITFGKYQKQAQAIQMPISVEVHHSLMDGLHVGRYLTKLQQYLDNCEEILA